MRYEKGSFTRQALSDRPCGQGTQESDQGTVNVAVDAPEDPAVALLAVESAWKAPVVEA